MRKLLLIILSLVATVTVFAESHYKPHISMGVHGGYNLSRVSFMPSVEQDWHGGKMGGVSLRYAEEKLVGLLGEINFTQRGWKEKFEESPLHYSRTFNYVSVPIMTHVYFGPPRLKFFFNVGPEFSYLISESTNANFDYTDPFKAEGWPNKARMTEQMVTKVKNRFDYGICAGFGCEFWLQPRHSIYAEARYYFGLGNVFPSSKADTFSASRNMTLSVTLGYNFRIK